MAEIAINFVASRLADVLDQIQKYRGIHREVNRLQTEFKLIQCFLKDADEKQEDDERVRNWISDIRNVAYDAGDLIDSFLLKIEMNKRRKFLKRKVYSIEEWMYRAKVKKELEAILSRIRDISVSRETYGITNLGHGSSRERMKLRKLQRSSPRGEEMDIVGQDEETTMLVAQLVRKDGEWRAFCIVGMGGIGKTTLAKRVYNHGDVKGRFNCRAWVFVSQDFSTRDILLGILKQVTTPNQNLNDLQEEDLEEILYNYLLAKCYLVVLDNMWRTEVWDCLANAFPNRRNGSRLMITSRNKNVALNIDAQTSLHELQLLNEDDSWDLFCRKAFIDNEDTRCPLELEETGRAIAGKCDGLPLAIIVLGGLVSRKKNRNEWERVLSNIHSRFARDPSGLAAILALSYKDLPQNLKSCFLYMGLFPEDHFISTRKLFHLWVAEGFVPRQRGDRMEDVAEGYLNELIDRNMVQEARMSNTERVKECRLHDLLRELSISKARDETFLEIHWNFGSIPSSTSRHHAIYSNFKWYASLRHSARHLRSLFFFSLDVRDRRIDELDFVCRSFKLLRVLDLEDIKINHVPDAVGELLHLKYLGLRRTNIYTLPSTLNSLRCLQTLDAAANCYLRMPNVVYKIENLRHLYMCVQLYRSPLRVDTLHHLQTLSKIDVDNWMKNNPVKLISLRKLGVEGSFASHAHEIILSFTLVPRLKFLFLRTYDVEFPSLVALSGLRSLTKLHMRGGIRNLPTPQQFPPNLSHLILHHSSLTQKAMQILEKLRKLLILRLKAGSFGGSKLTISANGFHQLKFLEIDSLEFLEELNIKEGAMPRLGRFRICNCRKLSMLPEEMKCITTLQELEIKEMRNTFIDRLQGEDFYKVQHIPTIKLV